MRYIPFKVVYMSKIVIESGIQQPQRWVGKGAPTKYPVDQMKVGQSFFVPEDMLPPSGWLSARGSIWRQAKKLGFKMTARQIVGGLRVWRIE